jgi:hypothetical protein
MDLAGLGIVETEGVVRAVPIGFSFKLAVELAKITHQIKLKDLHVRFMPLTPYKLPPGTKQIFQTNYVRKFNI